MIPVRIRKGDNVEIAQPCAPGAQPQSHFAPNLIIEALGPQGWDEIASTTDPSEAQRYGKAVALGIYKPGEHEPNDVVWASWV